jgi:hypothetical protein
MVTDREILAGLMAKVDDLLRASTHRTEALAFKA